MPAFGWLFPKHSVPMKEKKEKKETANVTAGRYTKGMIDLLGYNIIKSTFDATILYIEDAQRLSNEVRSKGLQCAGLLVTIIVALITGICTIENLFAKTVMMVLSAIFANCLRGIFNGVIYRKENASRGNVHSNLLNQGMIDTLCNADKSRRDSIFFASQLRNKEKAAEMLNRQTDEMQTCFEKETKTLITLITWVVYIASAFAILFYYCHPVY